MGLAEVALQDTLVHCAHGEKRNSNWPSSSAAQAKVLFLDEPMAGVNTEDVPMLVDLIGRLHAEGRTVVMVEHHMAVVVGLAQKIAVLDFGRLLASVIPKSDG